MATMLPGGVAAVVQGGQIILKVYFETHVSSGQQAPASSVTIEIAAATDQNGAPVPTAGEGSPVTETGDGLYSPDRCEWTYRWRPGTDVATGDYLVTWRGVVNDEVQTWQQTITVVTIPGGSPAPGVYATIQQYRGVTGDQFTPDSRVGPELRKASRVLRHHTMGAVYPHTPNGMPTEASSIAAFMEAACYQAQFQIDDNDRTGVKRQYSSTSANGVGLGRKPGGDSNSPFPPLAPMAATVLHDEGLLSVAVMKDW